MQRGSTCSWRKRGPRTKILTLNSVPGSCLVVAKEPRLRMSWKTASDLGFRHVGRQGIEP